MTFIIHSFEILQQIPPPHSRTQLHNRAPMAFTSWSQPAPHTPIQSPIFQPHGHSKVPRHSRLPASPLQPPVSLCSEASLTNNTAWWMSEQSFQDQSHQPLSPLGSLSGFLHSDKSLWCPHSTSNQLPTPHSVHLPRISRKILSHSKSVNSLTCLHLTSLNTRKICGTQQMLAKYFSLW